MTNSAKLSYSAENGFISPNAEIQQNENSEISYNVSGSATIGVVGGATTSHVKNNPNISSKNIDLAAWFKTPEAFKYRKKWVVLSTNFEVIESASAPKDFSERILGITSPLMVFVADQLLEN